MADQLSGVFAAYGVLGALVQRSVTGLGQQVSTSLLASSAAFAAESIVSSLSYGTVAGRYTRAAGSQAFAFTCRDGQVVAIHLSSTEKFWQALQTAVDDPRRAADPMFSTRAARVANYDELYTRLAPHFRQRDRDAWLTRLTELDVPSAPMSTVGQVGEHPQVQAMGILRSVPHPLLTDAHGDQVANPVQGDLQRSEYLAAPLLGEHTTEVLGELGLDEAEIAALIESGAAATAENPQLQPDG
jgi:crotonobetainyl-CoA:carnitine CoA-transferase CaiB-like acyl-CoA transferase